MSSRRTLWLAGACVTTALIGAPPVLAQSCQGDGCTVNHEVSATVGTVMELTLGSALTALTNPTAAVLNTGSANDAGPSITVKANRTWNVQIHSNAANWSYLGPVADPSKPAGDLRWSTDGSSFTDVTTSAASIFGTAQAATDGSSAQGTITWQTAWGWAATPPGDYGLVVVFTLLAP
jgi:hypothetical protein